MGRKIKVGTGYRNVAMPGKGAPVLNDGDTYTVSDIDFAAMQAAGSVGPTEMIVDLGVVADPGAGGITTEADPVASSAVTAHLSDTSDAHHASAVSVNPSGLVVVTTADVQAALAQLDTRLRAVPTLDTTGIADGQLMQWNATLGKFAPVNKPGAAELAYASNITGTTTAVANAANVDLPGVTFTVQPDTRPVYLQAGAAFQQTTTGDGSLILHITEVGGTNADVHAPSVRLPNTVTAGIKTAYITTFPFRVGAVAAARTFKVSMQVSGSGATPAVVALNSATNPSWLRAFA